MIILSYKHQNIRALQRAAKRKLTTKATGVATGPISHAYKLLENNIISFNIDKQQLSLCSKLDELYSSFKGSPKQASVPDEHLEIVARYYSAPKKNTSFFFPSAKHLKTMAIAKLYSRPSLSKGLYIHGSVGVGKSLLMDTFYSICNTGISIHDKSFPPIDFPCKRYHFHEFMIQIHERIHENKKIRPKEDPIPKIAADIAEEARILCFDEMQITDIADAMIIKRILTLLMDHLGVVVITTSNRPPSGLYEGGINRSVFLPLIDTMEKRMHVFDMNVHKDYRREQLEYDSQQMEADLLPAYVCVDSGNQRHSILTQWFERGGGEQRIEIIPVAMGRTISVEKANDSCAWFHFRSLCHEPLGAADYISIANRFDTVIIDEVPQLNGQLYNEAKRFVVLIDAFYEAKTKLVLGTDVSRENLFLGFDAIAETQDGDEEIAATVVKINKEEDTTFVIGHGGSSSSASTTMVRGKDGKESMEWSATGRIGVSLAQLSAVQEVSFSFKRAASRLAEMASTTYTKRTRY